MTKPTSVERYFKLCSYLLMSEGFATLALTGSVDIPSMLLYLVALILSWFSDKPGSKLQISPKTANWLALSFLPFIYLDWRFVSATFTGPLIHYSLFISIFNLFKVKADRDWVFLYLIAIFEVLLAATLTIDFTFILMLSIFVMLTLATLEVFEIKRSGSEVYRPKDERLLNRIGRILPIRRVAYLVPVTFVMVLLIGVIAAPIFLLIPRFNSGFMAQSFGSTMVSLTGFSDIVELGDVSNIKKSEQVVMHVRVKPTDGQIKAVPKWRGVTLSQYDGRAWREPRREQRKSLRAVDGQYKIAQRSTDNPQVVEQTFYLEPLNTPVVFVANRPIAVGEQLPSLYRLQSEALLTSDHSFKQITYTAYSDLSQPSAAQLRGDEAPYEDEIKDRYLQLPEMDRRIGELAQQITHSAGSRWEKAQAIEQYLKTKYSYTLDLRRTAEPDPIADFLFNIRAGHCEYFASSMVIMLRNLGIASRIVNGFQTGEYNEVGGVYTVRQSDAHSWVEVYFPTQDRWIEFDPTPDAGFSQYASGIANRIKKYFDAMRMLWLDYVVTYDSQRQSYLAATIQQTIVRYKIKLETLQLSLRQILMSFYTRLSTGKGLAQNAGGLIGLVLLLGIGFCYWRFNHLLRNWQLAPGGLFSSWLGRLIILPWLRWRTRDNPKQSAVLFYNEMLASLSNWGMQKKPSQTPLEFAVETKLSNVRLITGYYNRVRFSGGELNANEWQEVREIITQLRRQGPAPEAIDKALLTRQRFLAAASISGILLVLSFSALYIYSDQRYDKAAAIAQIHINRFNTDVKATAPAVTSVLGQVRSEAGNGSEEFLKVLADRQPLPMSTFTRIPWDDYFDSSNMPDREQLQKVFERADILALEQVATRQEFHLINDLADYPESSRTVGEAMERSPIIDRTDIMLWKAYIFLQDKKDQSCQRELNMIISLGEHLTHDYSFSNLLLGNTIMARGSLAMAKYYRLNEAPDETRRWLEIAREYYRHRAQLLHLYQQIHIAGSSDASLTALIQLADNKERGVAHEAIAAIGKDWLANPKNIPLGLPSIRRAVLERFTLSADSMIAKSAAKNLLAATEMGLGERIKQFKIARTQQ